MAATVSKIVKFDVLNRFSGRVQFTAEIVPEDGATTSIKLGLAISWAIKNGADLRGADLYGADLGGADLYGADLYGADLYGANLRAANLRAANLYGANLRDANLYGANLRDANLRAANLYGANLVGANLRAANLGDQWIIQGATRSDGYTFSLQKLKEDKEPMIKAGCRYFTIEQGQKHWETTRKGQKLLEETRAIVRDLVDLAHIRGFMKDGRGV